jgi:hypothetical protein
MPSNKVSFDESFLTSPGEMIALLAQLAAPLARRRARGVLYECLTHQSPAAVQTHVAAFPEIPSHKSTAVAPPNPRLPAQASDRLSAVKPRKHCQCGCCKWCLDNVRWDRIYAEKFADPAYYGPVIIRHNSSLAGVSNGKPESNKH